MQRITARAVIASIFPDINSIATAPWTRPSSTSSLVTNHSSYLATFVYLSDVWKKQQASLKRLKRLDWAEAEFTRVIDELEVERNDESWRKLGGLQKLRPRQLVVARELFRWRERIANDRNQPIRRILRDDLILG